ncbi:MAG: IS21-like element helper ATPase IstB [Myxococcales bacterium]|nr:IS21-like element helper ATPase IstB [Myxococcales bacterium]MDD9965615.1 IS21-like element helper ATPase IstB [Myxococcales bacterium]
MWFFENKASYPEFLFRVVSDELERREAKQLQTRLRRANFEHAKTLEDFDFAFNPNIPKHKVIDLATCAFVKRRRNALLLGDTGTGKSHVAQAIGHRACLLGLDVLFISAQKVFTSLRAARADDSYDRVIARYTRPDLLVLDDLGLRALVQDEPLDLYEIIRCRYEQGAILATSNRAVDEWPTLFDDALMASAAMDRLLHDAAVLSFEGESYRNPNKKRRAKGKQ